MQNRARPLSLPVHLRAPRKLIRSQILKWSVVRRYNWLFPLSAQKMARQQEIAGFVNSGPCACFSTRHPSRAHVPLPTCRATHRQPCWVPEQHSGMAECNTNHSPVCLCGGGNDLTSGHRKSKRKAWGRGKWHWELVKANKKLAAKEISWRASPYTNYLPGSMEIQSSGVSCYLADGPKWKRSVSVLRTGDYNKGEALQQ